MEFWGVEVKAGESLKVRPELFKLIHVSQAAIGEVKDVKEAKNVPLRVTVGENSYVIGTLSAEDRPQLMFDLVFEKEFELSHGWKNGSVYFIGYMADDPSDEAINSDEDDSSEEEAEENILDALVKGKPEEKKVDVIKAAPVKSTSSEKANVTKVEPKKEAESDDDDSEDDDDDDVTVGSDSDGPEGMDFSDDSDDESEEESESDEDTPQKGAQKKRPAPVVAKGAVPVSAKKAKQATPDKSGGKKGPATATPASAKQNGKPFANGGNKQAQTPKSAGKLANKNFGSQQKGFKGKHGKK